MKEIDSALADISKIRSHLAASTCFLGIAPEFHTLTGVFAFFVALLQSQLPAQDGYNYILIWTAVIAVISTIAAEKAVSRSRRLHGDMAVELLRSIAQRVVPFVVAAVLISWIICSYTMENAWMLPGIWQILIGLAGFAVIGNLPRGIIYATLWYFASGVVVLWFGAQNQSLSPWMMGIPLTVGQILVGVMLGNSSRRFRFSE